MNDLVRFAQGVQTATGKKRGRHPVFNSRMFYPYKEELRLQVALKAEISRYIAEAYAVAVNGEAFSDDLETLANFGGDLPEDFRSEVSVELLSKLLQLPAAVSWFRLALLAHKYAQHGWQPKHLSASTSQLKHLALTGFYFHQHLALTGFYFHLRVLASLLIR